MNAIDVAGRLSDVRKRIAAAGGDPTKITVVAVTKGQGAEAVKAALAAGLTDLGENYAGELRAKSGASADAGEFQSPPRWHFLGHVQRNKVRHIASLVNLWQGVDRLAAGQEIARRAPGARVLVQVNASGEPGKNGCTFDDVPALVDQLTAEGLEVRGLMAVGPQAVSAGEAREAYRRVVSLADQLDLHERSMGMSDDLELAIGEGSTMVRVGRALFGARKARTVGSDLRR